MIPERLCSSFIGIPRDFLAAPGVLKLLVYQVLLRELCPHCAFDFKEFLNSSYLPCARHINRSVKWWINWSSCIERIFGIPGSSLRFCNAVGCNQCKSEVPLMSGVKGRTAVAEMLSMRQDAELFSLFGRADQVEMRHWVSSRVKTPCADPDMRGKSARECALYKMSIGQLDPRELESNFGALTQPSSDGCSLA